MKIMNLWYSPQAMKINIALAFGFVFPILIYLPYWHEPEPTIFVMVVQSFLSALGTALIFWLILNWVIKHEEPKREPLFLWILIVGNLLTISNTCVRAYQAYFPGFHAGINVEAIMGDIGTSTHLIKVYTLAVLGQGKTILLLALLGLVLKWIFHLSKSGIAKMHRKS